MYSMIRPLLFSLDAERAHHIALAALDYAPAWFFKPVQNARPVQAMGLEFPHPLGLAAGLDKNGEHLDGLAKVGFSFIELGTVTPKPQTGNPRPRLFRLPSAQALINRMGFNNLGVDALVNRVKQSAYKGILGINIGKNKITPLQQAADDYLYCLNAVYAHASYVVVNISSPNTPELRQLQQGEYLSQLLSSLREQQKRLEDEFQRHVPLVVKISPDEDEETIKNMLEIIIANQIEGIIVTNTTNSREKVAHLVAAREEGGLSGQPLASLSLQCLHLVKRYAGDAVTLIAAGGIDDVDSAQARIEAGASLLQVYTGLIYQGTGLVNTLVTGLNARVHQ